MQEIAAEETVELVIKAAGVPLPTINWIRNRNNLQSSDNITITTTEDSSVMELQLVVT